MAKKLIITFEDDVYEQILNVYKESKKSATNTAASVEEFVGDVVKVFIESQKQMEKFGEQMKSVVDMFGSGEGLDFGNLFDSILKTNKDTEGDKAKSKDSKEKPSGNKKS